MPSQAFRALANSGLLKWRPGGGNIWFLPGTPMDGKIANEFQAIVPRKSMRSTAWITW